MSSYRRGVGLGQDGPTDHAVGSERVSDAEGGLGQRLRRLTDRLPWWVRLLVGLAAVALGLWLIVRPLTSINLFVLVIGLTLLVNGLAQLVHPHVAWPSLIAAAALVAAGIVVFAFRGFTTSALAVIVAVALIVIGVLRAAAASRPGAQGRATSLVLAATAVLAGTIALAWPDVTLLVTAVAFGGWTIILGVHLVWDALAARFHHKDAADDAPAEQGWFARSAPFLGALVTLVLVLVIGVVSVRLHQGAPDPDDFYASPTIVPSEPGVLLRAEPFTRAMPADSQAWRILYTTTKDDGQPALASALVIAPRELPSGPLPLIAWTHGTTGFAQNCAPSMLADPLVAGAMFTAGEVVAHGWAMVATDYVGLGTEGPHPYLIGQGEGRSALDSIRAAHQLRTLTLSDQTVVWGHSQGGHAALWAGGLASIYAPELDIVGVAALAPASDLEGLVANLPTVTGGILFAAFALAGYDAAYDDVRDGDYVDPSAQTLMRELSERCLADPRTLVSVVEALAIGNDRDVFSRPLVSGPMLARLQQNTPRLHIDAPLLLAQGLADPLVVPAVQLDYVRSLCDAGQEVDYLTVPGEDHVGLVTADSPLIPQLITWTRARLAGDSPTGGCDFLPTT